MKGAVDVQRQHRENNGGPITTWWEQWRSKDNMEGTIDVQRQHGGNKEQETKLAEWVWEHPILWDKTRKYFKQAEMKERSIILHPRRIVVRYPTTSCDVLRYRTCLSVAYGQVKGIYLVVRRITTSYDGPTIVYDVDHREPFLEHFKT